MTTIKKTIKIHTNNFKDLYKRLLLQPITFNVTKTDDGCSIELAGDDYEKSVSSLVTHLTNTVFEAVTNEAISEAFIDKDAYPEWASARLAPKLGFDEMDASWKVHIRKDIERYVEQALETDKAIKLDAYILFGTQDSKVPAKEFGEQLEEVAFYGIIESTISALEIESLPEHEVPSGNSIELVGNTTKMKFLSEPNDEGVQSEVVHTDDFVTGVANLYAESVYFPGSDRYKEAQFYTYTLMMMKRWNINRWIVPNNVYETLEGYRKKLDIPVIIETKGTTD